MFFPGSRYATTPDHELVDGQGHLIRYKGVRFVPPRAADRQYTVRAGDRLDLVAYLAFRDPERFWLLADANQTLWPPDLTAEPGRTIAVPPAQE
jgi:hypothetical protein